MPSERPPPSLLAARLSLPYTSSMCTLQNGGSVHTLEAIGSRFLRNIFISLKRNLYWPNPGSNDILILTPNTNATGQYTCGMILIRSGKRLFSLSYEAYDRAVQEGNGRSRRSLPTI